MGGKRSSLPGLPNLFRNEQIAKTGRRGRGSVSCHGPRYVIPPVGRYSRGVCAREKVGPLVIGEDLLRLESRGLWSVCVWEGEQPPCMMHIKQDSDAGPAAPAFSFR